MKKITTIILGMTLFASVAGVAQAASIGPAEQYNPHINPADFTIDITNPYFTLPVGKKMVYESKTEEGIERIEVVAPGWTKTVMGLETLVFWDRVYLNDALKEDTRDYLAQHKNGDLWYFGEHVDNYVNGKLQDHDGTWVAGENGAKAGIWMLANPKVGDEFRNEYYAKEAEDISTIVAVNETVIVPQGTFTGCVKTFDWTPLDPNTANKYFCKQVGSTALEVELPNTDRKVAERSELIQVDLKSVLAIALPAAYAKDGITVPSAKTNGVTSVSGENQGERTWVNKDADGSEREDSNNWLSIVISGFAGLILGVVLQKFVLGKRISAYRFGCTNSNFRD